jgi:Tfp pilus assembly protein PilO
MKDLVNNFIEKIHFLILIYGAWIAWEMYDEHSMQLKEITERGSGLEEEIIKTKKKVKEIKEFAKKTDEYKLRVEEVAKNIESVQKQLPADTNDTQILTFFQSEINSLNIRDANFVPGGEEKSTYFISKDYTLKGKGTFLQFLIFLERLGKADRIYNIKELKLFSTSDGQKGRFQIISGEGTIQAYRFNPDFKVDRGF